MTDARLGQEMRALKARCRRLESTLRFAARCLEVSAQECEASGGRSPDRPLLHRIKRLIGDYG